MTLNRDQRRRAAVEHVRALKRSKAQFDTVYRNGRWRVSRKADGVLLPGEYMLETTARHALNSLVARLRRKNFSEIDAETLDIVAGVTDHTYVGRKEPASD